MSRRPSSVLTALGTIGAGVAGASVAVLVVGASPFFVLPASLAIGAVAVASVGRVPADKIGRGTADAPERTADRRPG